MALNYIKPIRTSPKLFIKFSQFLFIHHFSITTALVLLGVWKLIQSRLTPYTNSKQEHSFHLSYKMSTPIASHKFQTPEPEDIRYLAGYSQNNMDIFDEDSNSENTEYRSEISTIPESLDSEETRYSSEGPTLIGEEEGVEYSRDGLNISHEKWNPKEQLSETSSAPRDDEWLRGSRGILDDRSEAEAYSSNIKRTNQPVEHASDNPYTEEKGSDSGEFSSFTNDAPSENDESSRSFEEISDRSTPGFHKFNLLPPELRIMIWVMTFTPRVIAAHCLDLYRNPLCTCVRNKLRLPLK